MNNAIGDEDFPEIMPLRKGVNRLVLKTVNRKVIWNMGFLHLKHLAMLVGMVDVIFSDDCIA
uniref:Uncharacterized protein n=1 Tax=Vitis vinifera TaxID=29760 RepID=F6GXU0_VITVI